MVISNKNRYKIDSCYIGISWRVVQKTSLFSRSSKNKQAIQIQPTIMPTGEDYRIPWHNLLDALVVGDMYSDFWGSSVMPVTGSFSEKNGLYSASYRIGLNMLPEDVHYILFTLLAPPDEKAKFKIDSITVTVSAPDSPTSGCKEIIRHCSKDVIESSNSNDSATVVHIGWLSRDKDNWNIDFGTLPEFAKNGKKIGGKAVVYINPTE